MSMGRRVCRYVSMHKRQVWQVFMLSVCLSVSLFACLCGVCTSIHASRKLDLKHSVLVIHSNTAAVRISLYVHAPPHTEATHLYWGVL